MHTELYLACDLKKDTREDIIKWLTAMIETNDYEHIKELCPKELKNTRFSETLLHRSYYFKGSPVIKFMYDRLSESYNFTLLTNLKNYNNEIERLLKLISPYMDAYNKKYVGYIRYEEDYVPDLLTYEKGKIVRWKPMELIKKEKY